MASITPAMSLLAQKLGMTPNDMVSLLAEAFAEMSVTYPITAAQGGTGVATLTGHVKGNGTSAFTASATIPFADLVGAKKDWVAAPASADATGAAGDIAYDTSFFYVCVATNTWLQVAIATWS